MPKKAQEDILEASNEIILDGEKKGLTVSEVNENLEQLFVGEITEVNVEIIKLKYSGYEAEWLSSESPNPSITHERFYGKKFLVNKGFYDHDVKKYVIPSERYNCRCRIKILGKKE